MTFIKHRGNRVHIAHGDNLHFMVNDVSIDAFSTEGEETFSSPLAFDEFANSTDSARAVIDTVIYTQIQTDRKAWPGLVQM